MDGQSRIQPPVRARHVELSFVSSADDEPGKPSDYLISLALDAADHARKVSLEDVSARLSFPPLYPDVWPGEHYKLLAGLILSLNPRIVVEIGTGTGLSALSMLKFMRPDARLATFDLTDWRSFPNSCFSSEDFDDGRLVQYVDDLSNPLIVPLYHNLLTDADIIVIDAAKNGIMERRLIESLESLSFKHPMLAVFDDIRLMNMLDIWRSISRPKLDVTSFGHWSGTGFVDWR